MSESPGVALPSLTALCLVLVLGVFASAPAAGVVAPPPEISADEAPPAASTDWPAAEFAVQDQRYDIESNTTFVIELQTNGDARWTITERFNVTDERDREKFDDIARDFESNSVDGADLGLSSFVQASEVVNESTEREMRITEEERTSAVEDGVGTLTVSFTWENFARIDGDRLVLDDVYGTEEGTWFKGLTASQELLIRSPDGFGFDDANVLPDDGQLRWVGPQSFTNETLNAVLVGNGESTGPDTPSDGTGDGTTTPGDGNGSGIGSSIGIIALVLGGIGALGAVVAIAVMAGGRERIQTVLTERGDEEDERDEEPTEQPQEESTESESEVDLELLSDEERVERLLEQNGGRMKQATIVKETGWSNAKVSQLLSAMEEEDRISKLRIGRENLISFPDEDITEIGDK